MLCGFVTSKRIINLGPVHIGRDSPEPRHQPVGIRVICGHCSNTFLVTNAHPSANKGCYKLTAPISVLLFFSHLVICCGAELSAVVAFCDCYSDKGLIHKDMQKLTCHLPPVLVDRVFRPDPGPMSTLQKSVRASAILCLEDKLSQ